MTDEKLIAELRIVHGDPKPSVSVLYDAASRITELRANLGRPITMPDVRLIAGEGKLDAATVLAACNAVLRGRAGHG